MMRGFKEENGEDCDLKSEGLEFTQFKAFAHPAKSLIIDG